MNHRDHARRRPRGGALKVALILLIVLGALASMIFVSMNNCYRRAQEDTSRVKLSSLKQAFQRYNASYSSYPSQIEGFSLLIKPPKDDKPLIREHSHPKDAWGNRFRYFKPARDSAAPFELTSDGPDGVQGTEDDIILIGELPQEPPASQPTSQPVAPASEAP